ncbi:MAG: tRNA (N6-isopentenyl adenosine(37)-C2)-methylthiotransferase MiaB [Candidatus Binatia bacterium]
MRTVYIETYGCQMNLADAELLLGHLSQHGYRRTQEPRGADVILINTCAIRERAEERVIGRLGDLARHKARRPDVQLGLAGCMAQHLRDRLLATLPFIDFIVGPDAYRRLPELLGKGAGDPLVDVRLDRAETYADIVPHRDRGVRAWVTVMRGCNKFCTFCVVPYVRGRERSLPAAALLNQVRHLAEDGYREVVYLGQTVNAYRDGAVDFAELLRRTDAVDGIKRIRFTSPHPSDMSDELIDAMASCPKVCPQLHLPVQSGSDRILAKMERGYTVAQYVELVERLRRAIPGLALSTDIIVGFPGEEDTDFRATCALMRELAYDSAFMFKYSPRPGTKAGKWPETVGDAEKQRRLQVIISLQEEQSAAINRALVGSTSEVLVEGPARRRDGWLAGKTPQFKTVVFPENGTRVGQLAQVRLTGATAHTLLACALSGPRQPSAPHGGGCIDDAAR